MHNKIKILHVDDEDDILETVKVILEKENYEVVSVKNGRDALKEVKLDGFGLIILDIMMPDFSGWDLFGKIAQIKPGYKVIFLSVLELSKERIFELKNAGVKDYIKKPFDMNDFLKRVKNAINS